MPMMMMMESDEYIDDLFGDGDNAAPFPGPVTFKALRMRIDELVTTGCCCRIAWSAQNHIASISGNGNGVEICTLYRRVEDGKWVLSDKWTLKIPRTHEEFKPVHISWGPLGSDLAVSDAFGCVVVYYIGYAYSKTKIIGWCWLDREDETAVIVGMRWLPVFSHQQRFKMFRGVTRNDDKWVYRLSSYRRTEPSNPLDGKSALLAITMNGFLRLLFQHADGQYSEVRAKLENITSFRHCITHAALGCDVDGTYYAATVSECRELHLYRIVIEWKPTRAQQSEQKSNFVPPLLHAQPVLFTGCDKLCTPKSQSKPHEDGSGHESRSASAPELTHLLFLPDAPETIRQNSDKITILAIFSYVADDHRQTLGLSEIPPNQFSVICRWRISRSNVILHPAFKSLASKKNASNVTNVPSGQSIISLERLPDITTGGVIITASSHYNDTMLSFCYSDGSVEFRDRPALNVIKADHDVDQISSLFQAGFAFPPGNPFLHVALSPSNCLAAYIDAEDAVKLMSTEFMLGSFRSSNYDSRLAAGIVALTMHFSYSYMTYLSADDVFAVMARDMSIVWERYFLNQAYHSLNTGVDFMSEESQKQAHALFRISPILRCLSVQNLFGLQAGGQRTLASKFAWIMLNLRLSFINITNSKEDWSPGSALRLIQTIKWFLDLATYIVRDLVNLSNSIRCKEVEKSTIQEEVEKMNSPALFLLLSSASRILIRMVCRQIRYAMQMSLASLKNNALPEQRTVFSNFITIHNISPVMIPVIEALVIELDPLARKAYADARQLDADRAAVEKSMLISCELPDILTPVAKHLLSTQLDKVQDEIDPARIIFADLRWLGLTEDSRTVDFNKGRHFDIIRKTFLKMDESLRRCTRCGACTLDSDADAVKSQSVWLHNAQKSCVCGNQWLVMPPSEPPNVHTNTDGGEGVVGDVAATIATMA